MDLDTLDDHSFWGDWYQMANWLINLSINCNLLHITMTSLFTLNLVVHITVNFIFILKKTFFFYILAIY